MSAKEEPMEPVVSIAVADLDQLRMNVRHWRVEGDKLAERLASAERERDDAVRSIADMAERFRAVNVSEAIMQCVGENVFALRERVEAAEAKVLALREHMQVAINLIVAQKEIRARLRLEIALSPDKPCQTS